MMSCSFDIDHYLNRLGCLKSHSTRASTISGERSAHARRLMFLFPNTLLKFHVIAQSTRDVLTFLLYQSINLFQDASNRKENMKPSQVSHFTTTSSFALQYPSHPLGLNNMHLHAQHQQSFNIYYYRSLMCPTRLNSSHLFLRNVTMSYFIMTQSPPTPL